VSYLATSFGWRWWIARKRRTRLAEGRALSNDRTTAPAE
jgi:hypothetical protein